MIYKIKENRVSRTYIGGRLIDEFYGKNECKDSLYPEDWTASITTIEEFTGAWTCTLIEAMGMQAPPEMMGITVGVNIEGSSVTLAIPELLGSDEVTIEGAFAESTLTVTIPAENEYVEDTVFALQLLEDGTMSISTSFVDELMVFYMSPVEVQE